jgi:hypothetical protein
MLNPKDMRERNLVKRLRDAKLLGKLDELLAAADTAIAQLPKVREGAPYEQLDEAISKLAGFQTAWAAVPGLNEVLPSAD